MPHDRSDRSIRWSWFIWSCFAVGLGAIAWLQIRFDRYNRVQQIAHTAAVRAANHQMVHSLAAQSTVIQYQVTHRFGDPNKPTIEQFCNDLNGGRPLGKDGVWQDPATGGRVRITKAGNGTFMAVPDTQFPPHLALARFTNALMSFSSGLERILIFACPVLYLLCVSGYLKSPRLRREAGLWLICLSFSLMFLGILGAGEFPVAAKYWGLGFLVFGGLYLAYAAVFGREVDPTPRCAKCQYNLTANESGVCPECGTPIGTSSSKAIG
jgi:hypothetical protein